MLQAHGGMERWRAARTLRYDNVFFNAGDPDRPWWVSRETFDLSTRHAYQDWPLDGASLAHDGRQVWSVNWRQSNPPKFMALFFYYFVNLPWLTQDPAARIGPAGPAKLPNFDGAVDTVRVTWGPPYPAGRTARDYFVLYVERGSGLLRGYQYGIGYGAMLDLMGLPPKQELFGPMLRFHVSFTTVGGLTFPAQMRTSNLRGSSVYGQHALFNYALGDPFDQARLSPPAGAVVDRSSATRQPAGSP
jgi:hypothetical protein